MANYTVKLADHTGSSDAFRQRIQQQIQLLFDQVYAGTPDTATVQWGTSMASDRVVLHFVMDVPSSYIVQQMPGGVSLHPYISGHTRTRKGVTGSEFYKMLLINGQITMVTDIGYAKAAFHEAIHNQYPYRTDPEVHGAWGGYGLAASPPQLPMTSRNIDLMRTGMAVANTQLL